MPTAEQLLNGAITDTGGNEVVTETLDKTLYIDFDTRQILIPECIHQLGVESDDDVKKLTFSVPRYYYGTDLSEFDIYINYMNAKKEGDLFKVLKDTVVLEGDNMIFDWIVGRHAVAFKGTAIFNVCMKKLQRADSGEAVLDEGGNVIVEQEFNTTVAKLPVLEGLETGEEVVEQYIDILMQWEEMLSSDVINTVEEQLDVKLPEYMAVNPPATHSWDGTVLTMTTAGGGTSSADLKGDTGAGLTVLGSYNTEAELKTAHPTGSVGDGYLINGYLYVWKDSTKSWVNVGPVVPTKLITTDDGNGNLTITLGGSE